jgi:uncharacterized membrane protein YeaQ/YmgE (transglycosylase-associated protein family)
MADIFGWEIGMTTLAAVLLVLGALIVGVAAQFIGEVRFSYQWVATGIAALVGGWLGSEALGSLSTWGPQFDGMYVLPAIIGGLIVGFVVDALMRYTTEGSYVHHAQPI